MSKSCYHCGTECDSSHPIVTDGKDFCCLGCKTVYEILSESNLDSYYDIEKNPGAKPEQNLGKYSFLENEKIVNKLLDFNDEGIQIVTLYIPHIHCSSCIWILENLQRLNSGVSSSTVNFPKKSVRITYDAQKLPLKKLVLLLSKVGYAPYISLEDYKKSENHQNRTIYYKLGVAGFAFGNVMLLSFPEYFEADEFWLNQYKLFFRWLMFALSLPVVFYAASDYFISAYKGLRSKILNIDVPLAIGILVLFLRSTYDIVTNSGPGFFDSLTGLLFFLLLGRFFQQKTYSFLSFERDYKSYFPIGITKINSDLTEEIVEVYDVKKGDRLLIRNEELIPVDSILIKGNAHIDYSFVTGEADPVLRKSGDKLFAGGKQTAGAIEVEVLKGISQSYLTQLWSNDIFEKDKNSEFKTLIDSVSKYFTIIVLSISVLAFLYWYLIGYHDFSWNNLVSLKYAGDNAQQAFNVFTAILIIACPCALAMSTPFTLGNMLRIFGYSKLYLKNAKVIEQMSKIDTIIFDKTGTITTAHQTQVNYQGRALTEREKQEIKSIVRNSTHPLSRLIYQSIENSKTVNETRVSEFKEIMGKGIEAKINDFHYKIGSAKFTGQSVDIDTLKTEVYISINDQPEGKYVFLNAYRENINQMFKDLSENYKLAILSGDNESEYDRLSKMLPKGTTIMFHQKPEDKLNYIKSLQEKGRKVMMIGDGLNDAGALRQSNVGIALAENVNVFSPACDGILDALNLIRLNKYLDLSKKSMRIIKISFVLSLLYNLVGLSFAVTGELSPILAAILMPLSSISIVIFTTVVTNLIGKNLG